MHTPIFISIAKTLHFSTVDFASKFLFFKGPKANPTCTQYILGMVTDIDISHHKNEQTAKIFIHEKPENNIGQQTHLVGNLS